MTISASASKEDNYAAELYPNIAAVASIYGDPDGKYLTFLKQAEPKFAQEAYYLWNQPFAEKEGLTVSASNSAPTSSDSSGDESDDKSDNQPFSATRDNGACSGRMMDYYGLFSVVLSFLVYLLI